MDGATSSWFFENSVSASNGGVNPDLHPRIDDALQERLSWEALRLIIFFYIAFEG